MNGHRITGLYNEQRTEHLVAANCKPRSATTSGGWGVSETIEWHEEDAARGPVEADLDAAYDVLESVE